jgi:hypothetical protein
MSGNSAYVFVLWGDSFDEVAATIFVTEMRKAGLRVKLVGLAGNQMKGAHGLALVPDFSLEQALTRIRRIVCLVIPCTARNSHQLKRDPRLREFFLLAEANQARFIVGEMGRLGATTRGELDLPKERIVYPNSEQLVQFAREIAGLF